jgi:hypothetical protein
MRLPEHPSVHRIRGVRNTVTNRAPFALMNAGWLKKSAGDSGAGDVGLIETGRPVFDDRRDDILRFFLPATTLLAFVCQMSCNEPSRPE